VEEGGHERGSGTKRACGAGEKSTGEEMKEFTGAKELTRAKMGSLREWHLTRARTGFTPRVASSHVQRWVHCESRILTSAKDTFSLGVEF
jgi:hypothetical protein